MKIVLISGTAPPEPVTAGRVHWEMAEYLSSAGNEVWLISPKPSRPIGTDYPRVRGNTISEINKSFRHVIVDSFTYPSYSLVGRSMESIDFGYRAAVFVKKVIKEYDFIYASPWAFLGHLLILLLTGRKQNSYIMNVQDLYPESLFHKLRYKQLANLFKPLCFIDRYVAARSVHVTVISESLKRFYIEKRGIPADKISVIPNWQEASVFSGMEEAPDEIRKKYELEDSAGKFVFMYLGNIGPVAGVEKLISSFAKLELKNACLLIAGSGSSKDRCRRQAEETGCKNIRFINVPQGLVPVAELQSIADVLLLPINAEASQSSIPSKLIAYMLSKKPIISSADRNSETGSSLIRSGCGWLTGTDEAESWKIAMQKAFDTDTPELERMGILGYDYSIMNYSSESGLRKISALLQYLNN